MFLDFGRRKRKKVYFSNKIKKKNEAKKTRMIKKNTQNRKKNKNTRAVSFGGKKFTCIKERIKKKQK